MSEILKNSIILDTETLGLERGAGMHELAIYDLNRKFLQAFVINPNSVTVIPKKRQEYTKAASTWKDVYIGNEHATWMDALNDHLKRILGRDIPAGQTLRMLEKHASWLHAHLDFYPHLQGKEETPEQLAERKTFFKKFGIDFNSSSTPISMESAINHLYSAIDPGKEGKTIWIANTAFESKQIGAQLGAMGQETAEIFKSVLETSNPNSPEPFYVTGSEVTRARVRAQIKGDWTQVWRAYVQYQPKAGTTAVRDIQDVTRAVHSYGAKLGFTTRDLSYTGSAIDISHQLLAVATGSKRRIGLVELHRAAEDAAIHESFVLRNVVGMATDLQAIEEGTARGQEILRKGMDGPLAQIAKYFAITERIAPALMEEQLIKRLGRVQEDFFRQGYTAQTSGHGVIKQNQMTPSGEMVPTYRLKHNLKEFGDMDSVLKYLEKEGRYSSFGIDIRKVWKDMEENVITESDINPYVEAQVQRLKVTQTKLSLDPVEIKIPSFTKNLPDSGIAGDLAKLGKNIGSKGGAFLGGASLLLFMGAALNRGQEQSQDQNLLHYSYDEWISRQAIEGLPTGTIAKEQRHAMTDFGSPYRGPIGVQQVFIEQEMLAERERWLRSQYGASHTAANMPQLPQWRPQQGYSFMTDGVSVRGQDYAMRGNLKKVNLSEGNWKISAEDADTVTLKRGGLAGALSDFFGMNQGYSFRLAGLDSPEIAHEDREAQPYANIAASAFQQMLAEGKNIEVVFDPKEISYGRALGAVIADGKNLNYELVHRGLASHLPYGKAENAIIDYSALEKIESRAYVAGKGMWSQPWARSFYEHADASGERVTLNTLAKSSKVASNFGTMQMVAAMKAAQNDNFFSENESELARKLGSSYNVGDDKVGPWSMVASSKPSNTYLQEQLQDLSGFIKTKGRNLNPNKLSTKGNYGSLDNVLVMDTLGTASNNSWSKRKSAAFEQYRSEKAIKEERMRRMAITQSQALNSMMSEPAAQHYRM